MAAVRGIKVALTQEEIVQIIGRSRETVTRTLANSRGQQIATVQGYTLLVQDMAAIHKLAGE